MGLLGPVVLHMARRRPVVLHRVRRQRHWCATAELCGGARRRRLWCTTVSEVRRGSTVVLASGARWRRRRCKGGVAQGARALGCRALVRHALATVLVLAANSFKQRLRLIKGHTIELEEETSNCGGEGNTELGRWRQW
ncbi:hypothetical protein U1Q18_027131 [Sarracenia purpurea var. burkii]